MNKSTETAIAHFPILALTIDRILILPELSKH